MRSTGISRVNRSDLEGIKLPAQKTFELQNRQFGIAWESAKNDPHRYGCITGYIYGSSSTNHFFKAVNCGREWCPICGKDRSIAHERRIERLRERFEQIAREYIQDDDGNFLKTPKGFYDTREKNLGYLVITCPEIYRREMENPKNLKAWKEFWKRKLKRTEVIHLEPIHARHVKTGRMRKVPQSIVRKGISRGIIRYHWCGDDGKTFKPHLNILIPKGYIDERILETWRRQNAAWFMKEFRTGEMPTGNLYYQYTKSPAKKLHILRYVTRATFRELTPDNMHLTGEKSLKGFRNTTCFGKFRKDAVPPERQTLVLQSKDPDTQEPINWSHWTYTREDHVLFEARNVMEELPAGIFMLPDILAKINVHLLQDLSSVKRRNDARNNFNHRGSSFISASPPS
jgi:hypothetical protein